VSLDAEFYTEWHVVINGEEQYSVWPVQKEMPLGWRSVEVSGTKEKCLEYIDNTWTDMQPLSLRKQMEAKKKAS